MVIVFNLVKQSAGAERQAPVLLVSIITLSNILEKRGSTLTGL